MARSPERSAQAHASSRKTCAAINDLNLAGVAAHCRLSGFFTFFVQIGLAVAMKLI
jgi:hypothetical protein